MAAYLGIDFAPPPTIAPECIICHKLTSRLITRSSNRKGNAGRPFYKCIPCNKFHCFDDIRGNDSRNPLCDCQVSSKLQVSGPDKRVARGLHYVCRLGSCNYYRVRGGAQERQVRLDADLVAKLAMLKII